MPTQGQPSDAKPTDVATYLAWADGLPETRIEAATSSHYEAVTRKLRDDFVASDFWRTALAAIRDADARYQIDSGYRLLMSDSSPDVVIKPYRSVVEKAFRKNILLNDAFPDPPAGGWIGPSNWYTAIKDLVRTTLTVKYLDGVTLVAEELQSVCGKKSIRIERDFEARMEGYYACHVSVTQEMAIPLRNWSSAIIDSSVEIQITTQLQDVIKKLLHQHYENRRSSGSSLDDKPWQWDYSADEFVANYLGHILHYVEGMIMDVRRRQSV